MSNELSDVCFQVSILNMTERMDAEFYRPSLSDIEKKITKKATRILSDYIVSINGGATPKLSDVKAYDLSNGFVPFIRVQNLSKYGTLDLDSYKKISKEVHQGYLARSQVKENDLLVKITGVGRMAIASIAPKGFEGNINQHVVVIKTKSREVSEYLCDYLNLDTIEAIAKRHATGGVRPALDYSSLRNIPIVDGIDFTPLRNAKSAIAEANKLCVELEQKMQEYIDEQFFIKGENEVADNVFYIQSSYELFDSIWTPNKLKKNDSILKIKSFELSSICNISKGQSIKLKDIIGGDYDVIGGGQSSPYTSNIYNVEAGAITISSSGAYAGYVWFHDRPIFASDCMIVRSKDEATFLTRYIYEVLKAYQKIIYSMQRGAGQPHVYSSDISQLRIPYKCISEQKKIIMEIDNMRQRIESIRNEAIMQYDNICREINQYLLS